MKCVLLLLFFVTFCTSDGGDKEVNYLVPGYQDAWGRGYGYDAGVDWRSFAGGIYNPLSVYRRDGIRRDGYRGEGKKDDVVGGADIKGKGVDIETNEGLKDDKKGIIKNGKERDEKYDDRRDGKGEVRGYDGYGEIRGYDGQRDGYGGIGWYDVRTDDYGEIRGYAGQKDGYLGNYGRERNSGDEKYNRGYWWEGKEGEDYRRYWGFDREGKDNKGYLGPRYLYYGLIGRHGLGLQKRNLFVSGLRFPVTPEILQPLGFRSYRKDFPFDKLDSIYSP